MCGIHMRQVTLYMVATYIVYAAKRLPVGDRLDVDPSKKLVDPQTWQFNVVDNPVPELSDFRGLYFFDPGLFGECRHQRKKHAGGARLHRRRRRRRRSSSESRDRWPVWKVYKKEILTNVLGGGN